MKTTNTFAISFRVAMFFLAAIFVAIVGIEISSLAVAALGFFALLGAAGLIYYLYARQRRRLDPNRTLRS